MAEFRKREDITHEIDLLQQWSDLGAPRIADLDQSLRHMLKTVDPNAASKVEIRTQPASPPPGEAPVPSIVVRKPELRRPVEPPPAPDRGEDWPPTPPLPPEFADLPPGDEEPGRGGLLPLVATGVLLVAAIGFFLDKDPFHWRTPAPSPPMPTGSLSTAPETAPPTAVATAAHAAAPETAAPSTHAESVVPSAATGAFPASAAPTARATTHATAQATALPAVPHAGRTPLPGLRPAQPVVRTTPKVTEYVVRLGDSLSLIAMKEMGDMQRWNELHALNRGTVPDADLIHPGQKLQLPAEAQAPAASGEVEYTSRPGDTLESIASAHLSDVSRANELYDLNRDKLPAQTLLPPGTVLRLPAAVGNLPPQAGAVRPGWRAPGKLRHHVVRQGESLSLLATRYLGSASRWPELYYLNRSKIANHQWIYPGQVLKIPSWQGGRPLKYVVKSGDTLWAIAARQYADPLRWPALYGHNRDRIRNPHWIYPGQVLRLGH